MTIPAILFTIALTAFVFGMLYAGFLTFFWYDERKRRAAHNAKDAYAALRYVRVSDTLQDSPIPSMVQTVKGKNRA